MELSEDMMLLLVMCGVTLLALAHPLLMWSSYLFTGTTIKKPLYGEKSYWEQRYTAHPDTYEWYASYDDLDASGYLGKQILGIDGLKFLEIGCGNSELAERMWKESETAKADIVSIDYSPKVIKMMKAKNKHRADKYVLEDATKMSFKRNSFDFVVDKATLDALLSSDDKQKAKREAGAMIKDIARVTNVGGTLLTVSVTDPKTWAGNLLMEKYFRAFQEKEISVQQGPKGKVILVHLQTWKRTDHA